MTASKKRSVKEFLPHEDLDVTADTPEALAGENPTLVILDDVSEVLDPVPETPALISDAATIATLMAEIAGMKAQMAELSKSQNRIIEETSDLTDNLWFITRPNGKKTLRKAIIRGPEGKAMKIMVEDIRTAFIGPFDTEENIRTYLAAKAKKRHDSVIDWATCDVMLGRDARGIQKNEEQHFQKTYGEDPEANVNVLERRVQAKFDQGNAASKAAFNLPQGRGQATAEVALPRVTIVKDKDGTETLSIRDR